MPAEDLDFSSVTSAYDDLVTNGASQQCVSTFRVVPWDPAASYLIAKVTGSGICFGTIMPKIGAALDPAEIDTIRAWIATGAAP